MPLTSSKGKRAKKPRIQATEFPWGTFMKRHSRAHLLTGVFDPSDHLAKGADHGLVLLRAVAQVLCRRGHYAVIVLRQSESNDLWMVGTECREDADRIARAFCALNAPRFDPWRSHRSFEMNTAAYHGIAMALARGMAFQGFTA